MKLKLHFVQYVQGKMILMMERTLYAGSNALSVVCGCINLVLVYWTQIMMITFVKIVFKKINIILYMPLHTVGLILKIFY